MSVLPDDLARFVRATAPEHDEIQREMVEYAEREGFPIIGPEAGAVLRLFARLTNARHVFEFGSGYGYSAYWFLQGMGEEAEVVLTEFDANELDMARDFFERADLTDRARFEEGDAVAIVDDYSGPFDLVLVDHQKHRYAEAFEKVKEKVAVGGVVVADNVMKGPIDFDALLNFLEGDEEVLDAANDDTRGIADYLETVRGDDAFETVVLPVGNGIAVTTRIE